jgi:penicillin-binding protein 2
MRSTAPTTYGSLPRQKGPRSFLPGDPRVEEPYRLTPQTALRVAILGFVALSVFAVLFLRLWALQVLSGDKYLTQANNNRVRSQQIEAPRGFILDRKGRVLVRNAIGKSLELWPADLPKNKATQLAELRQLATLTGVRVKEIQRRMSEYAGDPLTPVVIKRGLHDDQISYYDEHQLDFPGVQLRDSYLRSYPYQSLAAQVLGSVGEITQSELKAKQKQGYKLGDVIGQAGVEATYDSYLRGTNGTAQVTVDSRGRPTSAITTKVTPRAGNTIRLTIDIGIQRAAERALVSGIRLARANGEQFADGGAIVALDPRDGSVLAMASYPPYKPSVYVSRDPTKLAPLANANVAARENYPGLNRALDVPYPPGSTWKPVTALAALQEHIISAATPLPCVPKLTFAGQTFLNWDPNANSTISLPTALAESCDTFFYQVGYDFYALPPSSGHPLQQWASRFGFGQPTGIDIGPEFDGLVPDPAWRCSHFGGPPCRGYVDRIWKPGYSVQLAIGQGDLTVTPLQMARFYALIANGGQLVTPHVAEDVEQPTNNPAHPTILRQFAAQQPTPTGVDPAALRVVQEGLYEATHSSVGTSSGVFGAFPVSIAGKTGTAEKLISIPGYPNQLKLNQSWWCGYGPTDAPTIVVCAVIENGGHGGTAAAPAALQVFEKAFGKHATTTSHPSD